MSQKTLTITKEQEWIISASLRFELKEKEEQLEFLTNRHSDTEHGQSLIVSTQKSIKEIKLLLTQLNY